MHCNIVASCLANLLQGKKFDGKGEGGDHLEFFFFSWILLNVLVQQTGNYFDMKHLLPQWLPYSV